MTSLFSFLRHDLKVTPLDNNQVKVTLTLPAHLVFLFLRFLDSMTGIVQAVDSKARLHHCQSIDNSISEGIRTRDLYYQRIVTAYDHYQSQGMKRTAAINQISADLRKEDHKWNSVDLVRAALVAAGRPRRQS